MGKKRLAILSLAIATATLSACGGQTNSANGGGNSAIPLMALFAFTMKYFVQGMTSGAVKA